MSTQTIFITEGGPGTRSPTRIRYEGANVRQLLTRALGVYPDQILAPDWVNKQVYSVNAVLPPNSTKADLQAMILDLLTDRFQVVLRQESKEFRVYNLAVGEHGHKLRQSAAPLGEADTDQLPAIPRPGSLKLDSRGCPVIAMGQKGTVGDSVSTCTSYRQTTMAEFVQKIEIMLGAESGALFGPWVGSEHVVDRTGLTGTFDFELAYDFGARVLAGIRGPGGTANAPAPNGVDLAQALSKQLGLNLVKSPVPVRLPLFVVEHAERIPTPN